MFFSSPGTGDASPKINTPRTNKVESYELLSVCCCFLCCCVVAVIMVRFSNYTVHRCSTVQSIPRFLLGVPRHPVSFPFSCDRVRPGANVGPGSSAELKPRGVVKPKSLTVAESPMLSTKRRSAMRSGSVGGPGQTSEQVELDEAAAKQFRARPMPNYSKMSSQVYILCMQPWPLHRLPAGWQRVIDICFELRIHNCF